MKTVLILTMHGIPPKDFPRREIGEYFSLHTQMENSPQRMRSRICPCCRVHRH